MVVETDIIYPDTYRAIVSSKALVLVAQGLLFLEFVISSDS